MVRWWVFGSFIVATQVFVNSSAGPLCQVTPSKLGNMVEPGVTHNIEEAPSSSSQVSFLERTSI
jgi:hypothetical protein